MNHYLSPALFDFLTELKANNNREWFQENKKRYEHNVKEPLLQFIADFAPVLGEISPAFLAIPKANGGSLFRIYRDTRFSKDKTPYKTHAAIQFRHSAGKDAHAPGFYLHFEPGDIFVGAGVWRPDSQAIRKIRTAIAENAEAWEELLSSEPFATKFEQAGDRLKRPPKGFDADHPLIEELKRKDVFCFTKLSEEDCLGPDILGIVAENLNLTRPYMAFLTTGLDLPF